MTVQWRGLVVVGLLAGLVAYAEDKPRGRDEPKLASKIGMSAEIGGGVVGFMTPAANAVTQTGGSWTARLAIGTRSHIGAEAAYVASAQGMDTLGVADRAYLMSNGAEGNLRLNALTGALQPYATVGVAWRRYSVMNSSFNTSDVRDTADVGEIPVGLGLAYRYRGFVGDLRLSLRNSFRSALISNATLSAWDAGARIGWEF